MTVHTHSPAPTQPVGSLRQRADADTSEAVNRRMPNHDTCVSTSLENVEAKAFSIRAGVIGEKLLQPLATSAHTTATAARIVIGLTRYWSSLPCNLSPLQQTVGDRQTDDQIDHTHRGAMDERSVIDRLEQKAVPAAERIGDEQAPRGFGTVDECDQLHQQTNDHRQPDTRSAASGRDR